jgi:aryl-alcohol dehydrogenase-like predicted oxidoreductase
MSKLVFGTGGRFGRLSPRLAQNLVDHAIKQGITTFDTGFHYSGGKSQQLLFRCLRNHLVSGGNLIKVSTKIRVSTPGLMSSWIDLCISQLGLRGYVDFLFLWGPTTDELAKPELSDFLASLLRSGKVKSLGINTHETKVIEYICDGNLPFEISHLMLDYNMVQFSRDPLIAKLDSMGIRVWAGTALCQGFLCTSLLQIFLRTRSISYLVRALCNRPTVKIRASANCARRILRAEYPFWAANLPLAYNLQDERIYRVPVGMLSVSTINKNVFAELSPVPGEVLADASIAVREALAKRGLLL